jgi:hypothetical protein
MGNMSMKNPTKRRKLSPDEIDDIVVSEAQDETAWEPPVEVRRTRPGSFSIPPDLAERAAFLARVHHAAGVEEWLTRVIKERIELEEVAFAAVKREMKLRGQRRTNG